MNDNLELITMTNETKDTSKSAPVTAPAIVAVDDGYAQVKLYGDGEGAPVIRSLRSSVRNGRHSIGELSGDGAISSYTTEEGQQYTVSDLVKGESTQFDGFHTSPMNRVLINHALIEAGYSGKPVVLWAGLPVGDFYEGSTKNQAAIDAKIANLRRAVTSDVPGGPVPAELVGIRIGCQAVSAFVDWFIDDDFNERDVDISRVAVVDIGGRTTDIALILNGSAFDPSRSGTENIGALDVHASLNALVNSEFRTRDAYSAAMLDKAARTGEIRLWGKTHDITHLVNAAVAEHRASLERCIRQRLGGASDIDAVIFVGGGSGLFRGIEEMFPHGAIASDPEFSNARGLYKYAKVFG